MISGIFRGTLWNQTIPDRLRGRLAGIEQVSYSSGPLLGNLESGIAAALFGVRASVVSGGVLCVVGVGALRPASACVQALRRAEDDNRTIPPSGRCRRAAPAPTLGTWDRVSFGPAAIMLALAAAVLFAAPATSAQQPREPRARILVGFDPGRERGRAARRPRARGCDRQRTPSPDSRLRRLRAGLRPGPRPGGASPGPARALRRAGRRLPRRRASERPALRPALGPEQHRPDSEVLHGNSRTRTSTLPRPGRPRPEARRSSSR